MALGTDSSGAGGTDKSGTGRAVVGLGSNRPVYVVSLRAKPGVDPIRALRGALKVLGRRFGLRAVKVEVEWPEADSTSGGGCDLCAPAQPKLDSS
jgi:hypothetical protein